MTESDFVRRSSLLAAYDAEHAGPPGRARELISNAPAEDVFPAQSVSGAVDEVIRILDAVNGSGRLDYGDYCELHDAISSILPSTAERKVPVRLAAEVVASALQWERWQDTVRDIAENDMDAKLVQKMRESELLTVGYHQNPNGQVVCYMAVDIIPPKGARNEPV